MALMKFIPFGWFVACAALMVGCSSVPTRVAKGPVRASTYSLMSSKNQSRGLADARHEEVHQEIQAALAEEMERKGMTRVDQGGDVQVAYLIVLVDNVSTTTDAEYFGFGRDADALAKKAHKARDRSTNRDWFEVGALVVDVVNPGDSKLLYRSTAQMDVRNTTAANRADRVNRLVAACLESLPIEKE